MIPEFRIVLIDNPYDCIQLPLAQELFSKTIALKVRGYLKEYPYGVLPVDATDFVALHQVVCVVTDDGGLEPVMAYKTTPLERCEKFNLNFPPFTIAEAAGQSNHIPAIREIVGASKKNGISLCYDSSWTIDPSIRKNREFVGVLREIMTCMFVLCHETYHLDETIGCGAIRLKTDKYFNYWGYEPLTLQGRVLPTFEQVSLMKEEAVMMHLTQFTKEAKEVAERHRAVWDSRIVIAKGSVQDLLKAQDPRAA